MISFTFQIFIELFLNWRCKDSCIFTTIQLFRCFFEKKLENVIYSCSCVLDMFDFVSAVAVCAGRSDGVVS